MSETSQTQEVRSFVKDSYIGKLERSKKAAEEGAKQSNCCCGGSADQKADERFVKLLYSLDDIEGLNSEMLYTTFGCGNPVSVATLKPGETVLDLGSGAGLDVLLSARIVGETGKVYGLDMTEEMLATANANKEAAGIKNAEFIFGVIEDIPLPDNTVDCVISNCVINLTADKRVVMNEVKRVLKPGGRISISDILVHRPLPDLIKNDKDCWSSCISGALQIDECKSILTELGFEEIGIDIIRTLDFSDNPARMAMIEQLTPEERESFEGSVVSTYIHAVKPA